MRRNSLVLTLALAAVLAAWSPVSAKMFEIGGKPATVQGYLSQSVGVSLAGDYYDVEEDVNQALMNVFVEGDVKMSSDLSFYGAGMLTMDWMYDLKHNDDSWSEKRFNKSRDTLYIDDEWWQLAKEAHLTWTPGDFNFRIGKQIVRWGEMVALPVNDVITPTDNTHGLAEVELETQYIPIPLLNARYDANVDAGPFQQAGIQFIFNPNADFIPSIWNAYGNDRAGIWAADLVDVLDFDEDGVPDTPVRYGREDVAIEDPDSFDSDYFEYGVKISGITENSIYSLMAFYGINNWASIAMGGDLSTAMPGITDDTFLPDFSDFAVYDTDGNAVVNLASVGEYVDEMFVGASWSTELPISISSLGGQHPLLDVEVSYRFDDVFMVMDWNTGAISRLETDTLVVGVGAIWKMKVPGLKEFISLTGNAVYSQYMDEDVAEMAGVREDWWGLFFDMSTTYKRWNLTPGIWVSSEDNGDVVQVGPYINYVYSSQLSFDLSASFFTGPEVDTWGLEHKDSIALKVTYQF
jgi:hypothetical protein